MPLFNKGNKSYMDLRQAQGKQQLEKLAYYDVLTSLPNQQGMQRYFSELSESRNGYAYASVVLSDIQQIDSVFGHEAAIQNVLDTSQVLRDWAGPDDMVCRESIDRFGLLLRCGAQDALEKRLRALLERLKALEVSDGANHYQYPISIACGAVMFPGQEEGIEEVQSLAVLAAKRAKANGLDCAFFSESLLEDLRDQKLLLRDAPASMEKEEFVPFFHPRYDMKTGRIVGAEVLARWNHPVKGLLLPSTFIPLLEQSGNLLDLDMYMLEQACKLIRKWTSSERMPVRLSVNMSERNIYRKDFVDRIINLVTKYGTPPCLIELELDARAVLENGQNLLKTMVRLHEAGFLLSADNFGTNYTSLRLFKDLPTDLVKLDKKWFSDEDSLDRTVIVIENVVRMAHQLGMLIVAQGIESRKHVEILTRIGCNYGQGFLFCHPMPIDQFEKLIL